MTDIPIFIVRNTIPAPSTIRNAIKEVVNRLLYVESLIENVVKIKEGTMKIRIILIMALLLTSGALYAQEDITVVAASSEAAEGLDLTALGELFRNSETIEDFEMTLNDPETGINNLDLNNDGFVDFIRVIDESYGDVHILVLQVPLSEVEFQDVATIEIERVGDEYNMQIHGNEVIYGYDYYVEPVRVHVHLWPIIVWIYRPYYRPYRSAYYWGFYPHWWRPYQPVLFSAYRVRTNRYVRSAPFTYTRVGRVHGVSRVNYRPRSSTLVRKGTVSSSRTGDIEAKRKTTVSPVRKTVTSKKTVSSGPVKVTTKKKGTVSSGNVKKSRTVKTKKVSTPRKTTTRKVTTKPKKTTTTTVKKTPRKKTVKKSTTTKSGKTVTKKKTVSTGKKTTVKKSGNRVSSRKR